MNKDREGFEELIQRRRQLVDKILELKNNLETIKSVEEKKAKIRKILEVRDILKKMDVGRINERERKELQKELDKRVRKEDIEKLPMAFEVYVGPLKDILQNLDIKYEDTDFGVLEEIMDKAKKDLKTSLDSVRIELSAIDNEIRDRSLVKLCLWDELSNINYGPMEIAAKINSITALDFNNEWEVFLINPKEDLILRYVLLFMSEDTTFNEELVTAILDSDANRIRVMAKEKDNAPDYFLILSHEGDFRLARTKLEEENIFDNLPQGKRWRVLCLKETKGGERYEPALNVVCAATPKA